MEEQFLWETTQSLFSTLAHFQPHSFLTAALLESSLPELRGNSSSSRLPPGTLPSNSSKSGAQSDQEETAGDSLVLVCLLLLLLAFVVCSFRRRPCPTVAFSVAWLAWFGSKVFAGKASDVGQLLVDRFGKALLATVAEVEQTWDMLVAWGLLFLPFLRDLWAWLLPLLVWAWNSVAWLWNQSNWNQRGIAALVLLGLCAAVIVTIASVSAVQGICEHKDVIKNTTKTCCFQLSFIVGGPLIWWIMSHVPLWYSSKVVVLFTDWIPVIFSACKLVQLQRAMDVHKQSKAENQGGGIFADVKDLFGGGAENYKAYYVWTTFGIARLRQTEKHSLYGSPKAGDPVTDSQKKTLNDGDDLPASDSPKRKSSSPKNRLNPIETALKDGMIKADIHELREKIVQLLAYFSCWPLLRGLLELNLHDNWPVNENNKDSMDAALLALVIWAQYWGGSRAMPYIFACTGGCVDKVTKKAGEFAGKAGPYLFGKACECFNGNSFNTFLNKVKENVGTAAVAVVVGLTVLAVLGKVFQILSGILTLVVFIFVALESARYAARCKPDQEPPPTNNDHDLCRQRLSFWVLALVWLEVTSLPGLGGMLYLWTPAVLAVSLLMAERVLSFVINYVVIKAFYGFLRWCAGSPSQNPKAGAHNLGAPLLAELGPKPSPKADEPGLAPPPDLEVAAEQQVAAPQAVADQARPASAANSPQRPSCKNKPTRWKFSPPPHLGNVAIGIRSADKIDASQHEKVGPGEEFTVSEERLCIADAADDKDDVMFLRLADGRGWLFDRHPKEGLMCVRVDQAISPPASPAKSA